MGTNESFDVQNTLLIICLLLLLTNVHTVSDLFNNLIICGVPRCHVCVLTLSLRAFYREHDSSQYHKVGSPIGNPKTHHTMHITAETCFVTGI